MLSFFDFTLHNCSQRVHLDIFPASTIMILFKLKVMSGNSSAGGAQPCQGWGRGFESRFPLHFFHLFIARQWRRSQEVRQRSAKPLYTGSNPVAASIYTRVSIFYCFNTISIFMLLVTGKESVLSSMYLSFTIQWDSSP